VPTPGRAGDGQHLIHCKNAVQYPMPMIAALALHCAALRSWSGHSRARCLNLNYCKTKNV
jgi:hypothetical protein